MEADTLYAVRTSPAHQAAYARQRNAEPNALVKLIASSDFNTQTLRPANPDTDSDRALINRVVDLCQQRHIKKVPDIYIISSPTPNAASIAGKSLVFTTTIMNLMDSQQLDSIIGHELSHHRHSIRDLITQTVVSTLSWTAGQSLWHAATTMLSRRSMPAPITHLLQSEEISHIPGAFAAMASVLPYHHFMEFESDKEGAELTSPNQMIRSLESLEAYSKSRAHLHHEQPDESWIRKAKKTLNKAFPSHPSTERRIARLEQMESAGGFTERLQAESTETAQAR